MVYRPAAARSRWSIDASWSRSRAAHSSRIRSARRATSQRLPVGQLREQLRRIIVLRVGAAPTVVNPQTWNLRLCFFSLLAARFSCGDFAGFFFPSFFLSIPLLIILLPLMTVNICS